MACAPRSETARYDAKISGTQNGLLCTLFLQKLSIVAVGIVAVGPYRVVVPALDWYCCRAVPLYWNTRGVGRSDVNQVRNAFEARKKEENRQECQHRFCCSVHYNRSVKQVVDMHPGFQRRPDPHILRG